MNLLNLLFGNAKSKGKRRIETRICRFEQIESRELLSVNPIFQPPDPINVGIVYHEEYVAGYEDSIGDTFTVAWNGGAGGTTLDKIVINTDLNGNGEVDPGEMYFNIQGKFLNGLNTYNGFKVLDAGGVEIEGYEVQDGGQSLVIYFNNFTADKQFTFQIDVDEMLAEGRIDAIVTGEDFAGTLFFAEFSSDDYENVGYEGAFSNRYDVVPALEGLLPTWEYYADPDKSDRGMTAGLSTDDVQQTIPKKGSLSGYVYEDDNDDGVKDAGERGIGGVAVELQRWNVDSQTYERVARTTTNASGYYEFLDIETQARYRVVEAEQPEGYVSGKNTEGSLGGVASFADDWISTIDVDAHQHGVNYNFGELARSSLSGFVYDDTNDNGIKETGELGIEGVYLTLQVREGSEYVDVTTVRTDRNGYYLFSDLDPNKVYRIVETQPDGYLSGKNTAGTIAGAIKGSADDANDWITNIDLAPNKQGVNYNFGELNREIYAASISGYVYLDTNNDGVKDRGEIGLGGVWVALQVRDGNSYVDAGIAAVRTNADGYYEFRNLDPNKTYRVVETQPEGYISGKNTAGTVDGETRGIASNLDDWITGITLGRGEHGRDYNFGELDRALYAGSLSGYVYVDRNDDGIKQDDEEGIAGATVHLWIKDTETGVYSLLRSTTTDGNGYYAFTDLDPGRVYMLTEEQPEDYLDGKDSAGTLGGIVPVPDRDEINTISVGLAARGENYNFGEKEIPPPPPQPGSLAGSVYVDANENGVRDTGELGIAGVTVILWKYDAQSGRYEEVGRTTTGTNGEYAFTDLDPENTYRLTEIQPTEYDDGDETVGDLGGTAVLERGKDDIYGIRVGDNQHGTGYDFGELVRPAPPVPGSLAGSVYIDANENARRDPGELGIAGATVILWKLDAASGEYAEIARTTTDANGEYVFLGLDPNNTYRLTEIQPDGYEDGEETVGNLGGTAVLGKGNDDIYGIDVGDDEHGTGYDFGEIRLVRPGSISGHVYEDDDDDGEKDPDEEGIPGVVVELCRWNEELGKFEGTGRTAVTDVDGKYEFTDLEPGTYCVTEIRDNIDDEYCDGKDTPGKEGAKTSTDASRIYNIEVGEGENVQNNNFGELKRGFLSGYVYVDANENGRRDSGEAGIAGVKLHLSVWDETLQAYRSTERTATTDADGYYIFDGLCPSKRFMISEDQPTEYNDGEETVGTLGGVVATPSSLDRISDILMTVDGKGQNYNFGEFVKPVDPPVDPTPVVPGPSPIIPPFTRPTPIGGGGGTYTPASNLHWTPNIDAKLSTNFGGSGFDMNNAFYLSVINAGHPRELDGGTTYAAQSAEAQLVNVAWTPTAMDQGIWIVLDKSGKVKRRSVFGIQGAEPVAGDFNGDGIAEMGLFINGNWYLDVNGNGIWDADDILCVLGTPGDQPLVGDWDGDGKVDIGIFGSQRSGAEKAAKRDPGLPSDLNETIAVRPKNIALDPDETPVEVRSMKHSTRGAVRVDAVDHVFQYGTNGDIAVTGDWNGDGITKIGVYRNGNWYLDYNGDGRWNEGDIEVEGRDIEGAVPVVGDWNGEGLDRIGLFVDGKWNLDTTGNFEYDTVVTFGQKGDKPVVADFTGDGIANLAVYRPYAGEPLLTEASPAEIAPRVAGQFGANDGVNTGDAAQHSTLPEHLMQRPERTIPTPHTNVPLGE